MVKVYIEGSDQDQDEKITTTIKQLPEDKEHHGNAEIEGSELVLRAGLDALHRAVGKSHGKGGINVSLDEGDFIYSVDPSLKLTKGEAKLFELKTPTVKKAKAWTPAKMVERNIDVKDYNRLINILDSTTTDHHAKTSAAMMLQKYVNTLGQIAYIQESKKGEPAPQFAQGSAPVYNADLKEEIDGQPQYLQYGGFKRIGKRKWPVNARPIFGNQAPLAPIGAAPIPPAYGPVSPLTFNPLNPIPGIPYSGLPGTPSPAPVQQAVASGFDPLNPIQSIPYPVQNPAATSPVSVTTATGKPVPGQPRQMRKNFDPSSYGPNSMYEASQGEITPTGLNPSFNKKPLEEWYKDWEKFGVILRDKKPEQQQDEIYEWALKNNPDILRDMWTQYGINNKGKKSGVDTSDLSEEGLRNLKTAYKDNLLGARTIRPQANPQGRTPNVPQGDMTPAAQVKAPKPAGSVGNIPNPQFAANTTLPYNPNIPLSPLQSLNVLYSGAQALTIPKFYPMRPQVQSPLVELEKLDPRAQINQAQQAAYQAYQSNSTLNPVLAAANNANVYGRSLENINQIQSQYDNQNVQIANQQNQLNNRIQREDQQANIGFNQQYFDRVTATNQNYADERRYATNQTVGLFNQYRSQNDALAASLQSQRMYTKPLTDKNGRPILDKNGQQVMQQAPLYDVNVNSWTPQVYYTGAGGLDNVPSQPNTGDLFNQTLQSLLNQGVKPDVAAVVAGRLSGRKEALQYSVPQYGQRKLGGTIKRMRKTK